MKQVKVLFIIFFITMLFPLSAAVVAAEGEEPVEAENPSTGSAKEQGIDLFMDNKPEEAAPLLQTALRQEPENGKLYLYLAVCYEQMGDFHAAQEIYRDGLPNAGSDKATFYYNMGVNYQRLEEHEQAKDMYKKALELNSDLAGAYLNRANLNVRQGEFSDAVADYRVYLSLRPNSDQKDNIQQMIALLNKRVVEAERKRLEEERKRREEEQRQQALLDQVLSSLEESGGETTNLSAGTGEVKEYDQEFDIVD